MANVVQKFDETGRIHGCVSERVIIKVGIGVDALPEEPCNEPSLLLQLPVCVERCFGRSPAVKPKVRKVRCHLVDPGMARTVRNTQGGSIASQQSVGFVGKPRWVPKLECKTHGDRKARNDIEEGL